MIRNPKALLLAGLAVLVMSAIGASTAQATEFECAVEPCTISSTPDGTGTTAHHVFDAPGNGAITCGQGSFSATGVPNRTTMTRYAISYESCTFLGQPAFVKMNGCNYDFDAHGAVNVSCVGASKIEFGIEGCIGTVGSQTLSGLKDSGEPGQTVTVSVDVSTIGVVMEGPACIATGTFNNGRITTGNTLLTASDPATGQVVDFTWDTATIN